MSTNYLVNMQNINKSFGSIEALKNAIWEIADIIDMQLPLRYQDKWLEIIKDRGLYDGHIED